MVRRYFRTAVNRGKEAALEKVVVSSVLGYKRKGRHLVSWLGQVI